jgi:23S rRNA pseudouridine1911/1915/1917 synthase
MNDIANTSFSEPDADTYTFRIEEQDAGLRLDSFLAGRIEHWSRSRLQKLIDDGDVLVGGKQSKSSYKLRLNDVVEAELVPPVSTFAPENIPLDIVYEDHSIIVVNKQPDLVVHPAAGVHSGTLANALTYHFDQLSQTAGAIRPGIVHRLDRDTSGLMVVAKTDVAHENLADQFREREVFKSYLALVYGQVTPESGTIDSPLHRDPRNRSRMGVVPGGRPALSIYQVNKTFDRFTLLDVQIKTGRTHQIRVHLASIKHPVVGDKLYSDGRENTIPSPQLRAALRTLDRQFLHAAHLGFRHPSTGEEMRFDSQLPPDLLAFVAALEVDAE